MAKFKVNTNSLIAGAVAGAATGWASQALGPLLGPAVALGGVGTYMKNDTLTTLAGYGVGRQLMAGAPGQGGAGGLL